MTRPTRSALCACALGCAVAVAACSTAADHGDAGGVDAGPTCKSYAACTMLTNSDVARALGVSVDPGVVDDVNTSTTTSAPEQVGCDYAPGGAVIRFSVLCDSQNVVPRQYPDPLPVNVDGLGDQAYWQDLTPDGGAAAGKLVVWVGQHVQIDITLMPPVGGTFSVDPMMAAEQMAMAAILHL